MRPLRTCATGWVDVSDVLMRLCRRQIRIVIFECAIHDVFSCVIPLQGHLDAGRSVVTAMWDPNLSQTAYDHIMPVVGASVCLFFFLLSPCLFSLLLPFFISAPLLFLLTFFVIAVSSTLILNL